MDISPTEAGVLSRSHDRESSVGDWGSVGEDTLEGVIVSLPSEGAGESDGEEDFLSLVFWWVLMCLLRWSLRMKRLAHS